MSPQRQRKTKDPCPRCGLHMNLCICHLIPSLTLSTRILLVVHAKELKRTTNTGKLALEALTNSEIQIRGVKDAPINLTAQLNAEYQSVVYYPSDEALELNQEFLNTVTKPIQLIVPDGSWRQASKVHHRHSELAHLPRVMIKADNLATHHLRNESSRYGMSTLEAIARALGVIEGEEVKKLLLQLYQAKLQNTLIGRGKKLDV